MFLMRFFPVKSVTDLKRNFHIVEVSCGLVMALSFLFLCAGMLLWPFPVGVLFFMTGVMLAGMGFLLGVEARKEKRRIFATNPTDEQLLALWESQNGRLKEGKRVVVMKVPNPDIEN
jgi:hypothetical protein